MRVVDHVLAFWQYVIFPELRPLSFVYSYTHIKKQIPWRILSFDEVGCDNIIAEEILFCGLLRHYIAQNIEAITGTLQLNRFDIADSLCCMYLIDRFSQLLRCEVALHFINTWDINDLTFNY